MVTEQFPETKDASVAELTRSAETVLNKKRAHKDATDALVEANKDMAEAMKAHKREHYTDDELGITVDLSHGTKVKVTKTGGAGGNVEGEA